MFAGIDVTEGDARDSASVTKALLGCDAVISALGTKLSLFHEETLLSTATRVLVETMRKQKVTTGAIRALTDLTDFHGGSIARADVACFLIDELETPRWAGKSPVITSATNAKP